MNLRPCSCSRPLVFLATASVLVAGRGEFDFAVGRPAAKEPVVVVLRRNPLQAVEAPESTRPAILDRDDPASKLPAALQGRIRSVIRGVRPLILIEAQVFAPGDELKVAGESLLPKHRVILKSIEDEGLVLTLISLDPKQLGQMETTVPLASAMRRG